MIHAIHDQFQLVTRKFIKPALVASVCCSVLLLAACGNGSSSSSPAPAATANAQVQGNSVGQYANAMVCADINQNGVCDAGEPSTTTDATGGGATLGCCTQPLRPAIPRTRPMAKSLIDLPPRLDRNEADRDIEKFPKGRRIRRQ